jgi:hypothetical protein
MASRPVSDPVPRSQIRVPSYPSKLARSLTFSLAVGVAASCGGDPGEYWRDAHVADSKLDVPLSNGDSRATDDSRLDVPMSTSDGPQQAADIKPAADGARDGEVPVDAAGAGLDASTADGGDHAVDAGASLDGTDSGAPSVDTSGGSASG